MCTVLLFKTASDNTTSSSDNPVIFQEVSYPSPSVLILNSMQNEDDTEDGDGATVDGKDASQRNSGKSHKSSSKRRLVPPVIRHKKIEMGCLKFDFEISMIVYKHIYLLMFTSCDFHDLHLKWEFFIPDGIVPDSFTFPPSQCI